MSYKLEKLIFRVSKLKLSLKLEDRDLPLLINGLMLEELTLNSC